MQRPVGAVEPVGPRGSTDVQGHSIFKSLGGMLDSSRNAEHLVRAQCYFSAGQLKAPTALKYQDHLLILVIVRVRDRSLLHLDPGYRNAFADDDLSQIEVRDLFRFHPIPIVKTHLSPSLFPA